ncbi:signal peptidase I [Patescibacteria group bacterium]|nr:MAG: signal peptidase I [Patescibacteria group bacterium]
MATNKKYLSWFIYFAGLAILIFALPKLLSLGLRTPSPMAAITSGSMWPVLKQGDLIFIQGIGAKDLKIGDVVVYRNQINNTFTIHRIAKLEKEFITTKGDANFQEDPPVRYEDIVGRALTLSNKPLRLPYLGSITMLASGLK